jgi:hypothetical protein
MRVGRIMRDDRLDARHKRLAIWHYVLEQELVSGTQFVLAQPGGQMYAVIGASHEVLRVPNRGGAAWFGYLNETYGLLEHEPWTTAIHDAVRHYIQRKGVKAEMRRFAACDPRTTTGYISNYDGCMYKIDGEAITRVTNGEDGVFFADDDDGHPCANPDIGPHGMLLERLTNPNFAAAGLAGITPELQRKALTIWIFALAFPDLLIDKPILLVEGVMGAGKCLGRGTPVLMFDGSVKPVERVVDGDLVMGPDSKPRRVSGTTKGHGPLYRVTPIKGDAFVCNDAHVLTVVLSGHKNKRNEWINRNKIVDAEIGEFKRYQRYTALGRDQALLFRCPVYFPTRAVSVEPYLVGLWLGDGHKDGAAITKNDTEIHAYCEEIATQHGLTIRKHVDPRNGVVTCHFTSGALGGAGRNPLRTFFKTCVVDGEKRIPREYLINSEPVRLNLLAGLLDTDGYLGNNYYEITMKDVGLRDDVLFLARSLGFAAYSTIKWATIKSIGFEGSYYRVTISGHIDRIPCKLKRKQAKPRQQVKDVLRTGFKIEPIGDGEYFGFQLDGDGRFLLGDFTVTHNTSCVTHAQLVLTGAEHPMVLQRNKEDDFGVILTRSPIALFDNTDSFIDWVPDAIAAYATGAKWHKRRLFTDDENLVIKPQSFIAVATRNPASFRRDDVADRCLILRFDRRQSFTDRGTLVNDLLDNRGALFGEYLWFLGQISARIRAEGGLSTRNERFRMASFAALGRVIGRVLGWGTDDVDHVLSALQGERDAFVNEEDPLVELLEQWIGYKSRHAPTNIGRTVNANVLHAELETFAQSKQIQWKDTPRTLVSKLRSTHVERVFRIEQQNVNGQRHFRLWRHTDPRLELVPGDGEVALPEDE